MVQFGSRYDSVAQNLSAVQDPQGNLIVSPDNSFGASPLGIAARTQALYGIPNANFNLLPPDEVAEIATGNELPYWQIVNLGGITAKMNFDETAQAWGVRIDPSAAGSGDSLKLTTRSYLLNDTNLSLRQKAFASITKVGTMATSQWNLVMNATYYAASGSALGTYAIGTANSGTTWTSINGFTTSGTAAINAAAQYLDLDLTLTTTAAVTGTAKVDLTSVLLQTSTGGGASQSFLITQNFTSSGTFTVPTGVNYVSVVALSPGGGGQGGAVAGRGFATYSVSPAAGGATGYWVYARDLYVGNVASVSVGIGAGGTGGTARTVSKASGVTTTPIGSQTTFSAPGSAGATTFGSLISVPGPGTSGAGGTPTVNYGADTVQGNANNGANHGITAYTSGVPYTTFLVNAGNAGASGTGSGGTGAFSAGGTVPSGTGLAASGGAGGTADSLVSSEGLPPGIGGGGGGGGGAGRAPTASNQTIVVTGGAGGAGVANSGSGGGGGGGAVLSNNAGTTAYNTATITLTSGKGGDGATGFLSVIYIA